MHSGPSTLISMWLHKPTPQRPTKPKLSGRATRTKAPSGDCDADRWLGTIPIKIQVSVELVVEIIIHSLVLCSGDPAATQRFQKLGAAWDICQTHFEDPSRYVGLRLESL
jgi:hypothetical protein